MQVPSTTPQQYQEYRRDPLLRRCEGRWTGVTSGLRTSRESSVTARRRRPGRPTRLRRRREDDERCSYDLAPPALERADVPWTASHLGSQPLPTYSPAPNPTATPPTSFQLLLEDTDYQYDVVDNPVAITDWRSPTEWPAGAKPVSQKRKVSVRRPLSRDERGLRLPRRHQSVDESLLGRGRGASPPTAARVVPSPHVHVHQPRREPVLPVRLARQPRDDRRRRERVLRPLARRRDQRHRHGGPLPAPRAAPTGAPAGGEGLSRLSTTPRAT